MQITWATSPSKETITRRTFDLSFLRLRTEWQPQYVMCSINGSSFVIRDDFKYSISASRSLESHSLCSTNSRGKIFEMVNIKLQNLFEIYNILCVDRYTLLHYQPISLKTHQVFGRLATLVNDSIMYSDIPPITGDCLGITYSCIWSYGHRLALWQNITNTSHPDFIRIGEIFSQFWLPWKISISSNTKQEVKQTLSSIFMDDNKHLFYN